MAGEDHVFVGFDPFVVHIYISSGPVAGDRDSSPCREVMWIGAFAVCKSARLSRSMDRSTL